MIRVTIELVHHGIEEEKTVIGMARIWNTGKGSVDYGEYDSKFISNQKGKNFKASLSRFPRLREDAWDLLRKLLNSHNKVKEKEVDLLRFNYKVQKVNRKKIREYPDDDVAEGMGVDE